MNAPTAKSYLIHDRDPLFTKEFFDVLKSTGVESLRLPARSPNLNAYAERFVLSIKTECLNKMIFFSKKQLQRACDEFTAHYHQERPHQGLENNLIELNEFKNSDGPMRCYERLGGLLKYYHRKAA